MILQSHLRCHLNGIAMGPWRIPTKKCYTFTVAAIRTANVTNNYDLRTHGTISPRAVQDTLGYVCV